MSADVESIVDTGAPVCCKTRSQVTIWCVPLYVLSSGQGSPTLGVYFLFLIAVFFCVSEMTLEFRCRFGLYTHPCSVSSTHGTVKGRSPS